MDPYVSICLVYECLTKLFSPIFQWRKSTRFSPGEISGRQALLFFWGLGLGYVEIKQLESNGFQADCVTKVTGRDFSNAHALLKRSYEIAIAKDIS